MNAVCASIWVQAPVNTATRCSARSDAFSQMLVRPETMTHHSKLKRGSHLLEFLHFFFFLRYLEEVCEVEKVCSFFLKKKHFQLPGVNVDLISLLGTMPVNQWINCKCANACF